MDVERLADDLSDAHPWIQRTLRILKNDLHVTPHVAELRRGRSASTSCPRNHTSPEVGWMSRSSSSSGRGLAAAGFAHESECVARIDRQADVLDRAHDGRPGEEAVAPDEVLRQVPDVNEGHGLRRRLAVSPAPP